MSYPNPKAAMDQYNQIGAQTGISEASPHKLIAMLIEGALSRIAKAKGHIERSEAAQKGELIGRAIDIVNGLRVSLDKTKGGDVADNLDRLYDYMERRLLEASLNNNTDILDEVSGLLNQIKSAWDEVPQVMD